MVIWLEVYFKVDLFLPLSFKIGLCLIRQEHSWSCRETKSSSLSWFFSRWDRAGSDWPRGQKGVCFGSVSKRKIFLLPEGLFWGGQNGSRRGTGLPAEKTRTPCILCCNFGQSSCCLGSLFYLGTMRRGGWTMAEVTSPIKFHDCQERWPRCRGRILRGFSFS